MHVLTRVLYIENRNEGKCDAIMLRIRFLWKVKPKQEKKREKIAPAHNLLTEKEKSSEEKYA